MSENAVAERLAALECNVQCLDSKLDKILARLDDTSLHTKGGEKTTAESNADGIAGDVDGFEKPKGTEFISVLQHIRHYNHATRFCPAPVPFPELNADHYDCHETLNQ